MKIYAYLLVPFVVLFGCENAPKEAADTTTSTAAETVAMEHYGDEISPDGAHDMAWLSENVAPGDSIMVKVSGEITATCPMKGCWMKLESPEGDVRVMFKDYAFFVPKEGMEGKEAVIEGYAIRKVIDVETQRHMAKDAGKSAEEIAAITQPKEELMVEASGVVIR